MSLLPYFLGLRPMANASYVRIRGGSGKKTPTPSTHSNQSSEERSTMEGYSHEAIEHTRTRGGGYEQELEDLDAPSEDLSHEPDPSEARRERLLAEARQNRVRMDEQRTEAVQKAKEAIDEKMVAKSSGSNLQQTSTTRRRRNGGKGKQKSQAKAQELQYSSALPGFGDKVNRRDRFIEGSSDATQRDKHRLKSFSHRPLRQVQLQGFNNIGPAMPVAAGCHMGGLEG